MLATWGTSAGAAAIPSYTGQVVTRGRSNILSTSGASFVNAMCRTGIVIQETAAIAPTIQVVIPNWMVGIGSAETAGTGNLTVVDMAYSLTVNGARTRITFNGGSNSSSAAAPSTSILTDAIPNPGLGATLFLWYYLTTTGTKIQYFAFGGDNATYGDTGTAGTAGSPAANVVMAGSMAANNFGTNAYVPVLTAIGNTTKASVIIVGDSTTWSIFFDKLANDGRQGLIARSFANTVPFMNLGTTGSRGFNFVSDHPGSQSMLQYCSHMVNIYGINDFLAGQTAAQVQATHATIRALFPAAAKKYCTTIGPFSTTQSVNDGYTTIANQTAVVAGNLTQRNSYNTLVRALSVDPDGYFELCNIYDNTGTSGLWKEINPNGVRTVADGVLTAGSPIVTSATANFTSADIGWGMRCAGGGVAAADINVWIDSINSSTSVNVSKGQTQGNTPQNMTTSQAAAVLNIGGPTLDGTHPVPGLFAMIAASGAVPSTFSYP